MGRGTYELESTLTKRLLLENEEDSVDELNILEVVVDHVESDQSLIPHVSDAPSSQSHTTRQNSNQAELTGVNAEVLQIDQKKPCLRKRGML